MPPPPLRSGVIACGNDRSDEGIAPYDADSYLTQPENRATILPHAAMLE